MVDQFFEKLAQFKGKFEICPNYQIRECGTGRCPIIAVAGATAKDNNDYEKFGSVVGLSAEEARIICGAADDDFVAGDALWHDEAEARRKMLEALGLKETSE